jgi:hypothetical protein
MSEIIHIDLATIFARRARNPREEQALAVKASG